MRLQIGVALCMVAAVAAAAENECGSAAPWRKLPLATKPAEMEQLDPKFWQAYMRSSLLPHVVGAAIAFVTSLILLLTFLAWRLVKCCSCFPCVRGPRTSGEKARRVLAGRGARVLKACVLGAALGALIASVWGITQVDATMIDGGLKAIDSLTGFINNAVDAGKGTVAAVGLLEDQLVVVKATLDGSIIGPGSSYSQSIDSAISALSSFSSFSSDLDDFQSRTTGMIDDAVEEHEPLARTVDKWRAIALFIVFGLLAGLAVLIAVGTLVDWPAPVKPLVLINLILLILAWLVVLALTAVLRLGSDVCANVEAGAIRVLGAGDASALVTYYMTGVGGSVFAVLSSSLGIDVPAKLDEASAMLDTLRDDINANPSLEGVVGADFDVVQLRFADVGASVDALGVALSYTTFHPVWLRVKGFVCCTTLDSVGASWAGLIATATCGLILMITVFSWIGRMDSLRALGCCHIYSQRDYTLEGEGEDEGHAPHGTLSVGKKQPGGGGGMDFDPSYCPPSPTIMAKKDARLMSPTHGEGSIKASWVVPEPLNRPPPAGPHGGYSSRVYPVVQTGHKPAVPLAMSVHKPSVPLAMSGHKPSVPPAVGIPAVRPVRFPLRCFSRSGRRPAVPAPGRPPAPFPLPADLLSPAPLPAAVPLCAARVWTMPAPQNNTGPADAQ